MLKLGSKALSVIGLLVGLSGTVSAHTEVVGRTVGETAATIATVGGLLLTALGGSVVRPTNQRSADRR